MASQLWKLTVHEKTFSPHDVVIYKEYPDLKISDILEVYHPDGNYSRLLVEVKQLIHSVATQMKGSISIQSSLASNFQLRQYNNVCVNKVNKQYVTLDLVELVFKDQFVTRSDAWRLHQSLIGSCVYFCNKVLFTNMRVHVNEMWMKGEKVACGVIGESTKVVYRSQSSQFHIFIQMSVEMWEFDFYGDLYFEKAIMGFLQDLFSRWKDKGCCSNHDVVIVLFSRTYYEAQSIDQFSKEMQKEVLCSRSGKFYRDFYKIIRQSEKQDNLQNVILDLKQSFYGYPLFVGCQQPNSDKESVSPKGLGKNSRAAQGNLLEAINLSLNVFEKHYIDCNLEETNCTTLVITPSTGVFEVDEELTNLTRNRLIDNGVGVDLVCLAEQPLHVVPLLKFHQNTYNIPQWINHSYYKKPQLTSSVFVPRMQVPHKPPVKDMTLQANPSNHSLDMDEFDAQVFNYAKPQMNSSQQHLPRTNTVEHHSRHNACDFTSVQSSPEISKCVIKNRVTKKLSLQEDVPIHLLLRSVSEDHGRLARHGSYDDLKFTMGSDKDDTPKLSYEYLPCEGPSGVAKQSSINPFKYNDMATALTLFKHRWVHAFPRNMKGITMQEHHQKITNDDLEPAAKSPAPEVEEAALASVEVRKSNLKSSNESLDDNLHNHTSDKRNSITLKEKPQKSKTFPHEDWTATIITGVDWKSLCMPACLPLTTDYFPDETNLNKIYFEYHYTMVIEDPLEGSMDRDSRDKLQKEVGRFDRNSMPPEKKFMEMIAQRIGQGFQFVTNPDIVRILKLENGALQSMAFDAKKDYVLSLGLTIHHLKLVDPEVQVTRYSLREPVIPKPLTYIYNLWPHNCSKYSTGKTEFQYESADKYNWNNLDRYICETEKDYNQLNEHMKYWRIRFLLLPVRKNPFVKDLLQDGDDGMLQIEGFLRFLEGLNKIKRGSHNRQLFSCRAKAKHRKQSSSEQLKASDQLKTTDRRSVTPERKDHKNSVDKRMSPMLTDSQDALKDLETSAGTPRSSNSPIPNDMPPEHSLSINSPLQDIIKAMLNPSYGLYFLPKQDNLHNNTFISAEAVAWMIKSIDGCYTKQDAVALGQHLLEGKYIIHASESLRQSYVDGFFLYFIKEERKEEDTERCRWFGTRKTEEELLKSYNIQWLEVAVWRDRFNSKSPAFLQQELPDYEHIQKRKSNPASSVQLFKSMEYCLDPSQKSTRSEWCTINYHGNYYPLFKSAYAIELNWMAATGCIIWELVQMWAHRAITCSLHLVPTPMCAFPTNSIRCSRNPFRKSAFIHLNIECLKKEGQMNLFEYFETKTWPRRMFLFQEAILNKFDFFRDIPQTAPESPLRCGQIKSYQYIHSSGSVLIKINDIILGPDTKSLTFNEDDIKESPFRKNRRRCKKLFEPARDDFGPDMEYKNTHGFFWVYNYALSKKWRTNYTGDVASAKVFAASFSDFCANKDDELVQFWNEALDNITSTETNEAPGQ